MSAPEDARVWLHRNPSDWSQVLGEVPLARAGDVASAVERLSTHQALWRVTSEQDRLVLLLAWKKQLSARQKDLVEILIREVGKPRIDAEGELRYGLALLDHVCMQLSDEDPFEHGRVRYRPHGLVGLITPWNNPFAIPIGKIAPALGYGNTVLWKPALPATGISLALHESLHEAGLSEFVELVTGDAVSGRLLVEAPEIRAISFTGSVPTGRQIIRQCQERMVPVQAELGGNNAAIVLGDADVESVAKELAPPMFSFAGQRCTAIRRIIVADTILTPFAEAMTAAVKALRVGSPVDLTTQIGPVISRERQTFLLDTVREAVAVGGRILTGGQAPAHCPESGCWLEPTVITDLPANSPVLTDELFGPVVALVAAKNLDNALTIHNQVEYGLLGALFSHDKKSQARFMDRADAGILVINEARPAFSSAGPFIGWKASGFGPPEHGRWNRDFYSRVQAVYGLN